MKATTETKSTASGSDKIDFLFVFTHLNPTPPPGARRPQLEGGAEGGDGRPRRRLIFRFFFWLYYRDLRETTAGCGGWDVYDSTPTKMGGGKPTFPCRTMGGYNKKEYLSRAAPSGASKRRRSKMETKIAL